MESSMTRSNVDIAKEFLAACAELSMAEAINRHATPDFVWWCPGVGEIQDMIKAHLSDAIASNLDEDGFAFDVLATTSEGERVALEAESHATLRNGAKYQNSYHFLFVIRDGRVAALKEYNDTAHSTAVWGPVFVGIESGAPAHRGS
jgi:hypothetical protein